MTKRIAMTIWIKMEQGLDDIIYLRRNSSTIKSFITFVIIYHVVKVWTHINPLFLFTAQKSLVATC